jgi:glycerol-3-phosphate dehydrogenase (NAD(P)+)
MAVYLHRNGHKVTVVCQDEAERSAIVIAGENKARLPGISTQGVEFIISSSAPARADAIFVALPSHVFEVGLRAINVISPAWVSLAKGIVLETLTTPCETLERILKAKKQKGTVWCLSGPTHAGSVAAGQPCAMVLSGKGNGDILQQAVSSPLMRVYTSRDRRGAELGGALKNAFAVAAGISDGLGVGDNAKAGLLTRALAEMARLGVALGGKVKTFFGLTGAGDLMATSYGVWSRNRQLGERVARGEKAAVVAGPGGLTAEGYRASKGLLALARKKRVEAPVLEQLVWVLHEGKPIRAAMQDLMGRRLKKE